MGKFNLVMVFSASQKKERKESQQELAECADVASLKHLEMRAGQARYLLSSQQFQDSKGCFKVTRITLKVKYIGNNKYSGKIGAQQRLKVSTSRIFFK